MQCCCCCCCCNNDDDDDDDDAGVNGGLGDFDRPRALGTSTATFCPALAVGGQVTVNCVPPTATRKGIPGDTPCGTIT